MNSVIKDTLLKNKTVFVPIFNRQFRTKGVTIGKPPGVAPTITDVLRRRREKDESLYYKVDIGLPYSLKVRAAEQVARDKHIEANKKNNPELANLARKNELRIPLDEVYDVWRKTEGPAHIKRIADHYGIFDHLFGDAYFYPVTPFNVSYKVGDEYAPIFYGNQIKPSEAKEQPIVEFEAKVDTYHTLILTNLDGNLNTDGAEYVHWFVGNIPDGDVTKGETIYQYLQPFPTKGTGYHRLVFVLYEQTQKLDYSTIPNPKLSSKKPFSRTFYTYNFYKDRQDIITPVGLRFFQSDWDPSVKDVFHKIFEMPEPRFEYNFRKPYMNPQLWYPKRQPFNVYLDKYRDPKEISKEVLIKKLKTHHPFVKPDPPLKYPHAHSLHDSQDKPTWLQTEIKKERLGWGKRVNDNLDILYPEKM